MITGLKKNHHSSHHNGATPIVRREPCIWIRTDAELTVITFSGEIHASDVDRLSPYARRLVSDCGQLIVDLNGSDFIAVDALCALLAIWSPDPAATDRPQVRELRICSERLTVLIRHVG